MFLRMDSSQTWTQGQERTIKAAGCLGPILYFRGMTNDKVDLAALVVTPSPVRPAELTTDRETIDPHCIWECDGHQVHRYAFSLPQDRNAWYGIGGVRYDVDTEFGSNLRIAFVSCNGQEHGDRDWSGGERNALWKRMVHQHGEKPFQLLISGGDQIYADEIIDVHPAVREWAHSARNPHHPPDWIMAEVEPALQKAFFRRYVEVLSVPETCWLMARVPTLAIWDDHDICDGWGSMPETRLDAPIGRRLFAVARDHFILFQLGSDPRQLPEICIDQSGATLSWHARLPELTIIAPDLRSERRPERVMGDAGWQALAAALEDAGDGRVLLISSVPALGPRLSWVEAALHLIPRMQKYEDDLRDQWQSRAHRDEWRRFLETLARVHLNPATPVTIVSGEIHLATRATFDVPPMPMHQLVASGIAHPAPPTAYGKALGALARFGNTPVPGRAIGMKPLPGKMEVYTAQRNYLVVERQGDRWLARWELEKEGPTPALQL
jgi:hypothetical protein